MQKQIIIFVFLLVCALIIIGCEKRPDISRTNPLDPKSENYEPPFPSYMIPEMVSIPAVTSFSMGRPDWESGYPEELPVHPVNLNAFSMSKYEITIQQYVYFLNSGGQDSHYHTEMADTTYCGIIKNGPGDYSVAAGRENYPVVYVSWYDAVAFCDWLTVNTPNTYRLPTEAEWEYVAVGKLGHKTYPWGSDWLGGSWCNWATNVAGDGYDGIAEVGKYSGLFLHPFEVYDMAGNVWEWVNDRYSSDYYSSSPVNNPTGPVSGSTKVLRGGSWFDGDENNTRCAYRGKDNPNSFDEDNEGEGDVGFRPVKR